jgi:hypothetical protein
MIAALSTPPPAPQGAPPPPEIRDIAPPVDVFPWPAWMVALVLLVALALLAAAIYFIVRRIRNRPPPLPPSPRSVALRELSRLRQGVSQAAPYAFSIAVSDVLRRYVTAEYRIHATEQTSPEFLAAISRSAKFSDPVRAQLSDFLECCDLIKFARIDASTAESERLLESATRFVEGSQS